MKLFKTLCYCPTTGHDRERMRWATRGSYDQCRSSTGYGDLCGVHHGGTDTGSRSDDHAASANSHLYCHPDLHGDTGFFTNPGDQSHSGPRPRIQMPIRVIPECCPLRRDEKRSSAL